MLAGLDLLRSKVDGFRANAGQLRDANTQEAVIRQEYIDAFFRALGWDVANTAQLPPDQKEVVIEAHVGTIENQRFRSRRPDYLFRVNGYPRFIVEAKKAGIGLVRDQEAIFQAKTYAWNAQIPFAILTDFEEFRVFDCTIKPHFHDPARGLLTDFDLRYEDYIPQWDVLLKTFGRDAVADGSLERLFASIKKVRAGRRIRGIDRMLIDIRGVEPVNRDLLAFLEDFRTRFATEMFRENRAAFPDADTRHGAARLTEAAQRLIDRLIFMRACEDRDIAEWGRLRGIVDRAVDGRLELYELLTAEFRVLDREYNGYLFKPHFSEQLKVPGQLLADFLRSIYPPDGSYDFRAIGDDILGMIYEQFLGSVITVKGGRVEAEQKPEVRHAGGVHYTPRFVADTIIRRTIGPKIKDRPPLDVLNLKILDIACGSGSLLIAAFQYLIDYCTRYITAHPEAAQAPATEKGRKRKRNIAFQDEQGQWRLAPDFRAALLTNCLYGVDIDAQAVEVTIMSLYLKMLEEKLPPDWQRDWLENQLLPTLDNNIRCGNSLLSQTDFDRWWEDKHGGLYGGDPDVRFRMNPFDWTSQTRGFGRILLDGGGFDCIISNPPYIRVQELNKWAPDECEFYKWRYKSAAKGNYDIYVPFIERGLELLSDKGLLGYICPHKFWQASYGEGIRKVIADGRHLQSIIDFADQQIFKGATTYTAIQIFSKDWHRDGVDYARVVELNDGDAQCRAIDARRKIEGVERFSAAYPADAGCWRFMDKRQQRHDTLIREAATLLLKDVTDRMFQGVRTSMNEVFVVEPVSARRGVYHSDLLATDVELEPDLLYPFLGGEDIRKYEVLPPQRAVIFPYHQERRGKSVSLIPMATLKAQYPRTLTYLRRCEAQLRQREQSRMDHNGWYGYGRTQNLDLFGIPRIIVRDIVEHASFALDPRGEYAFVSGYGITLKAPHAKLLPYILGLLNSKLLDDCLKGLSTTLRGGWFRPFPQFLGELPIKLPETADEKKQAGRITERVQQIIDVKKKLQAGGLGDNEKDRMERQVESLEQQIDEIVRRLYGVDKLPTT